MKFKFLFIPLLLLSMENYAQDVTITDIYDDYVNETSIDTLIFSSGKPQVFLIQIKDPSDYLDSSELVEKNELKRNFNSSDFDFNFITKHSFINLENGQFIDVSDLNSTYGAVAFWSGNTSEKLKIQEGVRLSTEFVSEQLNLDKKSSYIKNSELYKKEIAQLPTKDNFTENSRKVMNRFLKRYSVPEVCSINGQIILNQNQDKVKTITGYRLDSKGKKTKQEQITLNELGYPTKISRFEDDGKSIYYSTEFKYENGILKSIINDDRIDKIQYNDNQLFFTSDLGGGEETSFYTLKDGNLLMKRILIMKNDTGNEEQNSIVEQRIENDCIHYYINNELWSTDCFSEVGKHPYSHKYTSFQNGEVLQSIDYKINKLDNSKIEMQIKSSESNSDVKTTVVLNNRGLAELLTYIEGNEIEKYQFEYTYFD